MIKGPLLQRQPNSTCPILYLPDLHKVKVARGRRALQFKLGEVQHNLHVDLHNDLEDTVSIVGIVVRVVGWKERPRRGGEGLTTVWWETKIWGESYNVSNAFHLVKKRKITTSLKCYQTFPKFFPHSFSDFGLPENFTQKHRLDYFHIIQYIAHCRMMLISTFLWLKKMWVFLNTFALFEYDTEIN